MNKLIKIVLFVTSTFALAGATLAQPSVSVGVAGNAAVLAATGVEKFTNGDTTKEYGAMEASHGAVFVEFSPNEQVTIGVEYVPTSIESDENINVQHDGDTTGNKQEPGGDAGNGSPKTNRVRVDIEDLTTVYAQVNHESGGYVKIGYVQADLITKETLGTGGSYPDTDIDGMMLGLGVNKSLPDGMFVRFEISAAEMDSVKVTNANDSEKTVELEDVISAMASVRVGKTF